MDYEYPVECPIVEGMVDMQFCFDTCSVAEHWAPEYTAPAEVRAVDGYRDICAGCKYHRAD